MLIKKYIRIEYSEFVENLETTAEQASREGNIKDLYGTIKKLAG